MNYDETIEFMFNSLPMYQRIGQAAYKADLNNALLLDEYTKHPHKSFKTIHVAGTNGKGSVSHSIASILQESGYKTGLYTSPHLLDYRERIRVNGEEISKEFVTYFINTHKKFIESLQLSFFEMSVALAFCYYKFCKVDVAVIEVGMGGRLDSTNVITPELSIITNIGIDHTQFLGDTYEKIAGEKAGIIKPGVSVVIGERQPATAAVFEKKAKETKSKISFASDNYSAKLISFHDSFSKYMLTKNEEFTLNFGLSGIYQERNIATVLESVDQLRKCGFIISDNALQSGLKNIVQNTGLRGRWEILNDKPLTICDTGHNREGLEYVLAQLESLKYKTLRIIVGFVNDKNVDSVLPLFPKNAEYYFTRASIPRAMDENILKEKAKMFGLKGEVYSNVNSAYTSAVNNSDEKDLIFIGGSTFIVADLLATP